MDVVMVLDLLFVSRCDAIQEERGFLFVDELLQTGVVHGHHCHHWEELITAHVFDRSEDVERSVANCFEVDMIFLYYIKQKHHRGVPSELFFALFRLFNHFLNTTE